MPLNVLLPPEVAETVLARLVEAARVEAMISRPGLSARLRRLCPPETGVAFRSARALYEWVLRELPFCHAEPAAYALRVFLEVLHDNGKAAFDVDRPLPFILA